MWIALLGMGIWYLSSSLGGASLSYTSLDSFMRAVGACEGDVCDIASANGCFLCPYVERLFYTIGQAAYAFWNAVIEHIWILMVLGFAIFLFIHTAKVLHEQNKANVEMKADAKKFDFQGWFDKVWKLGVRILIAGALIGAIGYGGTRSVKLVADVTITPVMFIGSELAMAATGVADSAQCGSGIATGDADIMGPAMRPFMCAVGNLNTVILAGASGGFSLMNYSWMGLGGGLFTWVAGLALVIMFLLIGFDVFFKILTVVFQLVFLIIFLPLFIAAWAYEKEWKMMGAIFSNVVKILAGCAVRIIAITLQILVLYAMVLFVADEHFPPPRDNYSAILPAGIAGNMLGTSPFAKASGDTPPSDATAVSVMDVFAKCEKQAALESGGVDKDAFKSCFVIQKAEVESRHPGAFDFMDDGFDFMILMIGIFLVYWYVIKKKIDDILGGENGKFDYGKYVKEFGQSVWRGPQQILDKVGSIWGKKT